MCWEGTACTHRPVCCEALGAAPAPSLQCGYVHMGLIFGCVGMDAALNDSSSINSRDTLSLETI